MKGQIELSLPAFVDVVGYLYAEAVDGKVVRRMLIEPANNIIAKSRPEELTEKYGSIIENANFAEWLEVLSNEY